MKFDTINKQSLIWAEENAFPSEPVFIGSPNSSPEIEDEGFTNFNVSYLVIILIILIDLIFRSHSVISIIRIGRNESIFAGIGCKKFQRDSESELSN